MTDSASKRPMNWEDYEYGRSPRQGSTGSLGSHVQFDAPPTPTGVSDRLQVPRSSGDGENAGETLRRRRFVSTFDVRMTPRVLTLLLNPRSSLSMRINSLAHAGGPNSLENFARSWSRAAGFAEIPQSRPSFITSELGEESIGSKRSAQTPSPVEARSLLRQQFERAGSSPETAIDDGPSSSRVDEEAQRSQDGDHSSPHGSSRFSDSGPLLASPFASSYGGVYGSFTSRANEPSIRQANTLYHEQHIEGKPRQDPEQEPLIIKVIEQEDGKKLHVIVGRSTLPQTVFNSVNVLIGVGLLSLPLGIKQAGWLIGMAFLFLAAIVTKYTARLLAKCLDLDPALVTFSDIAWKAFGSKVRIAVGFLFSIELLATCVALVVLFADSLNAIIPGMGITEYKILCAIILIPLSFFPLRYLSFTSVLGIMSCLGIVTLIFVDGIIKPHTPGSLREPAAASIFPGRWSDLPLSFGLLMSPWGGHSVFPNIYRDMRHPRKYPRAVNYTYVFTYLLDVAIAVAGYLMFGRQIHDEVTSNILLTVGYPPAISIAIVVFIAIIPITKVPLK